MIEPWFSAFLERRLYMWAEIKRVLSSKIGRFAVTAVIGVIVVALLIFLGSKKNFG